MILINAQAFIRIFMVNHINLIFSVSWASFFLKFTYSHYKKAQVQTCKSIFHGPSCNFPHQGCQLFSPKQENGQKWKVHSNFLSTVNDLKNFVWPFGSINDIIIEQCPSCLLNLVKFQLQKRFFDVTEGILPYHVSLINFMNSVKILFCFYNKVSRTPNFPIVTD